MFHCPICRTEYTYIVPQRFDQRGAYTQPRKIIAKVHFGDELGRDPVCYVTDIADFGSLLPDKYVAESTTSFSITTPDGGTIMNWINQSLDEGDNEFYFKKCRYR